MDVKKAIVTLCLATTYAAAHTGAIRNGDGFRVPSSSTLSQGFFFFSGNYETLSDGSPMAIEGYEDAGTGKEHEVPSNIPSSGGALQASYAPLDYFEFGIYQPVYYDGQIDNTDYNTARRRYRQTFLSSLQSPLKFLPPQEPKVPASAQGASGISKTKKKQAMPTLTAAGP